MIIKHVLLFVILLCWPFVSMAVDTSSITNATTISEAANAAKEELSKLNLQEPQKTQAEQQLAEAIEDAKCTSGKDEYCPATDNRLKSINDKTKIGDECSSTNIAGGEVVWHKQLIKGKKVCTCLAYACNDGFHSEKGGCVKDVVKLPNCPRQEYDNVPDIKTGNDALKFCENKGGDKCKTTKAVGNYLGIKGKVICNPDEQEYSDAKQRTAKYYNCGLSNSIPKDITCTFVQTFKSYNVTPMEADGLMKEWAIKNKKDDIKCDKVSHRKGLTQQKYDAPSSYATFGPHAQAGTAMYNMAAANEEEHYRQCVSQKNPKQFYEFQFKDLDGGNNGFFGALCSIWDLKSGDHLCKKANEAQCKEISSVVDRTFYPEGNAELKETDCVINEHPTASSASFAVFNTKHITKDDLRTFNGADPLRFYDKGLQVSASSDLYKNITHYLFVELGLPVKEFRCGNGFVDNIPFYNVPKQTYDAAQEEYRACVRAIKYDPYGGQAKGCRDNFDKVVPSGKSGDLLTCQYDGKPIDFLFYKLDVKWDKKSTAGYQGFQCLTEGGSFTGKSCTLASEDKCNDFNKKFLAQYPNSKGMEWNGEACVLKDATFVHNAMKVAEVSGMVALTLATSIAGGPVVWVLSVVEGTALITEAVTEEKISKWAESFLVEAANCKTNNPNCANAVMKRHIARIMEGSSQFSETQNRQIAKQTERLLGMLDESTLSGIVDKGELSGFIGEERDPDLEKSIRAYYGTQLTTDEKALLVTKKVATVATFATLIGAGVTAGLRQAFKHNWLKISSARQAKWVKLKILKPDDVAALAPKAADASADVIKTTGKTWSDDLAEIGVKEEKTANGTLRYRDIKTGKFISEEEVLQRIDKLPGKTTIPIGSTSWSDDLAEIGVKEEKTANGTLRYRDIKTGKLISEEEVLQRIDKLPGKTAAPKPVEPKPETKPVEPKPETKPVEPKPETKPVEPKPETKPQSTPVVKPVKTKAEKIAEARQRGDLGYHGTDADIAMDDMIRASSNTSDALGSVGYGIAKDYDAAERYAIKRLIERQNIGKDIDFILDTETNTLVITNRSTTALNLSNKTGYVYTTAKESDVAWQTLRNNYASDFIKGFDAAQMPHSVEILEKKALNLDDLVRQGRVKIVDPKAAPKAPIINKPKTSAPKVAPTPSPKATPTTAPKQAPKSTPTTTPKVGTPAPTNVATLRKTASSNFDTYLAEAKAGGTSPHILPKGRLTDDEWKALNKTLESENVQLIEVTYQNEKHMKFVRSDQITEERWLDLYNQHAPENETLEHFKKAFGNDVNRAKNELSSDLLAVRKPTAEEIKQLRAETTAAYNKASNLFDKFSKEHGYKKYNEFVDIRNANPGTAKLTPKTPGLETWTQKEIDEAQEVYEASRSLKQRQDANKELEKIQQGAPLYSTYDPAIAKLKNELHAKIPENIRGDLDNVMNKANLTTAERQNIEAYVAGQKYDQQMLTQSFVKNQGMSSQVVVAKSQYANFLAKKSESVREIDEVAGLHAGSQESVISDITKTGGKNISAKNEFIQNFVSKRVGMYEDIITKNPSIYERAKAWNQLSVSEREKLCKEIFETADTKLGVRHTEFAVKDLVKEFGESTTTRGLQKSGNVYLSDRYFKDMSFADVMNTISHEQAHKVDHLNPNKGILGSQLADLGNKEGYIQGYKGHSYEDYRLELTEQSSWQIGAEMKKAISRLGL